jgi:hypothetical protein
VLELYQKGNYELRILFESDLLVCVQGAVRISTPAMPESRSWHIANVRKNPYFVLDFYVQDWRWMGSIFNTSSLEQELIPEY